MYNTSDMKGKPVFHLYFKAVTVGYKTGNNAEAHWVYSIIQAALGESPASLLWLFQRHWHRAHCRCRCLESSLQTLGWCRFPPSRPHKSFSLVSRPQLFTLSRQCLPIIDLTFLFGQLTPSPSVQCLSTHNENRGGGGGGGWNGNSIHLS